MAGKAVGNRDCLEHLVSLLSKSKQSKRVLEFPALGAGCVSFLESCLVKLIEYVFL